MAITDTQLQAGPTTDNLLTGTDMLVPDVEPETRMGHFDPEVFDLRPTSHLSRFLTALLGESGIGGLQKSYLVNRLRNTMQTTSFLDLDRFYGALFGVHRRLHEVMPINPETGRQVDPHNDETDQETWDKIRERDASYRDRIMRFSKAIPLGGTVDGLRAAAEAMFDCPVQVYESWNLLDTVTPLPNGSYPPPEDTIVGFGRMSPIGNRAEVVLRPMRPIKASEHADALRVLSKIKPAGVTLTISSEGLLLHQVLQVRNAWSDSEFWEMRKEVSERTDRKRTDINVVVLATARVGPLGAPLGASDGDAPGTTYPVFEPPLSGSQGAHTTYAASVSAMRSYSEEEGVQINETSHHNSTLPDGTLVIHPAQAALLSIVSAEGGSLSRDGSILSHPYAEDRQGVTSLEGAP